MLDAITMWRHTKMVVLVALTGAAYVAILLPFKIATVVPGFTEIRPATGIPIVCGMLFGPAADVALLVLAVALAAGSVWLRAQGFGEIVGRL